MGRIGGGDGKTGGGKDGEKGRSKEVFCDGIRYLSLYSRSMLLFKIRSTMVIVF